MRDRQKTALLVLLCAAPVLLVFDFIHRYGVDVLYWDEWQLVPLYDALYSRTLTLGALFAQHNEHRILFPRIVMLTLGHLSDGNTISWMYATAFCLVATLLALYRQHRAVYGGSLFTFVPICWTVCTLRQAQNLLWGWQVQIALCVAAFVTASALLAGPKPRLSRFVAALACAEVASFSFAGGLLAWPALLCGLLFQHWVNRKERREESLLRRAAVLAALGVATWVLYFHGYVKPGHRPATNYVLVYPGRAVYAWVGTLGGALCGDVRGAAAMGAALLLLAGAVGLCALRGGADLRKLAAALPLCLFGWGSAASVAFGRSGFGYEGTTNASRYATMTLVGLVGLYLGWLSLTDERARQRVGGAAAVLFALGVWGSFDGVYDGSAKYREARLKDAAILRTLPQHPDADLRSMALDTSVVRERAAILARYGLCVFASP